MTTFRPRFDWITVTNRSTKDTETFDHPSTREVAAYLKISPESFINNIDPAKSHGTFTLKITTPTTNVTTTYEVNYSRRKDA